LEEVKRVRNAEKERLAEMTADDRTEELSAMKVPQLKNICNNYRISPGKTKAECISKILEKEGF